MADDSTPKGDYIQFRHVRPDGTTGFDFKLDLDVFGGDGNTIERSLKTVETVAGMFVKLSHTVDPNTIKAFKQ